MACLNAPKLLATVGTFNKEASNHLFSLLASLKIFSFNGAIFISTLAISSGNFFQLRKGYLNILEE